MRFQHANMKVGHYISRFKRSRPHFTFQNTLTFDDCTKDSRGSSGTNLAIQMTSKMTATFPTPYAKYTQINVISQQKIQNRTHQ